MFTQNFKIYNIACGSTYLSIVNSQIEKHLLRHTPNYNFIFALNKISTENDIVPNELYDRFIYEV